MSYVSRPNVVLGTNSFEGCESILALGEEPLLSFLVEDGALRVTLEIPSPPATIHVSVHSSSPLYDTVQVARGDRNVVVHSEPHVILKAKMAVSDDNLVEVETFDLRPIGLSVHADATGLHVGRSVMSHNVIRGGKIGIRLG